MLGRRIKQEMEDLSILNPSILKITRLWVHGVGALICKSDLIFMVRDLFVEKFLTNSGVEDCI